MLNKPNDIKIVERNSASTKKDSQGVFREFLSFFFFALVIVLPIRIFIAQPFVVNGASMDPTFSGGDYLIVDQISYRFEEPQRGDVVIFKYPKNKSKFFIKRIIGLPGESVHLRDGQVFISGKEDPEEMIKEDYVKNKSFDNSELDLEEDEYFVLGDNRPQSLDSRSWGVLPRNLIKGRALIRLLPLGKVDLFPGAVTNAP